MKCPGCEHRATTIHTLNEHVADEHGIKLQYVKRKFKNTGEFQVYFLFSFVSEGTFFLFFVFFSALLISYYTETYLRGG